MMPWTYKRWSMERWRGVNTPSDEQHQAVREHFLEQARLAIKARRAERKAANAARKASAIKRNAERAAAHKAECEQRGTCLWLNAKLVARAGLITDEQLMQAWTGMPRRPALEVKGFWLYNASEQAPCYVSGEPLEADLQDLLRNGSRSFAPGGHPPRS
jgi:hypothetical protein